MRRITRTRLLVTAVAAAIAVTGLSLTAAQADRDRTATAPAQTAGAKKQVRMTFNATQNGPNVKGPIRGQPFGKGRVRGKINPPVSKYTWKFKRGKVKVVHTKNKSTCPKLRASYRITGGSNRYKGAKGRGNVRAKCKGKKATFKYRGNVKF